MKSNLLNLFVLLFFLAAIPLIAQPVKQHGALSVKGTELVDQHGETVVLQGVSYGWHNFWPRFYNRGSVKWLADDWNCTVVRAAMGVEPEGGYLSKPEWSVEKIEAVVDGAIENNIYVIIDWHSHGIRTEAAKMFFKEMALKYGKYPNVIYEIFNEPVRDPWEDIKAYSIEVIKVIREIDPDNIILVGSPHWDQDVHLVADDPIQGYGNLMYTLHFYAATHKEELRRRGDYALEHGIPLFVSESAGMEASGNGAIDYASWEKWIIWMDEYNISRVMWSVSDKNETCSMLKKEAASDGNWDLSVLKESGLKTREMLRNRE